VKPKSSQHTEDQRARSTSVRDSPQLPILSRSVILGCFSPQDDATLKCWGYNDEGQLGLGDTLRRGDDANGPCPPSSTAVSLVPAPPHVLTCAAALRVQGWGPTSLRSTWGLEGLPSPSAQGCDIRAPCW